VRVERDDQLRRRHARPDAEIERVAPDHPPEEQIQALAAAARRRPREEVADAGTSFRRPRRAAVHRFHVERQGARRKAVERPFHIVGVGIVPLEEESFDRAGAFDHLLHHPEQRGEVGAARPSVHEVTKARGVAARIERADRARRLRTHGREQALDRLQHAADAAEREGRGAEADDFAIVRAIVAADDLNRIGGRIGIVEVAVQPIERRFEGGDVRGQAMILPCGDF